MSLKNHEITSFQLIILDRKGYILKEAELCLLVQKRVIFFGVSAIQIIVF